MARLAFSVTDATDGRRADALVRALLPECTPQDIRGVFARRDVKLDGVRIKPDVRVHAGQFLEVFYMASEAIPLAIVYRDEDVLAVNKRAGISVEEDGRGLPSLTTLVNNILGGEKTAVPCHRLDNQTCGLVVFALNPDAEAILTKAFKERTLDKRYICLVKGQPKPPNAVCQAWLRKDSKAAKVTVTDHEIPGSRPITTGYETMEAGNVSRLLVHLITGRTHQIRAHMAALGHPILGDDLYGDWALNRAMHAQGKLMLCAASLSFPADFSVSDLAGKTLTVPCPF